jgi:O-antigen/teichoic acid export membrane protein
VAAVPSLGARTARGVKWSYLSTLANVVLQVGLAAVMARLVAPQAYGLIAIANVALRFASYFSDMGVGSALVQKRDLGRAEIRGAFATSLYIGAITYAAAFVAAPLAASFFAMPALTPVLRVLGLNLLVAAVGSTAQNLLRREMRFRALGLIDVASFAVGYGVIGVGMALGGWGVWSLVASALAQSVIGRGLCFVVARHPVGVRVRWRVVRPLFAFGSRVSVLGFLEFLGGNLDSMAIGRLAGPVALGVYNRGNMLAMLPMQQLTDSISRVLLPTFGRLQDDLPRLRRAYLLSMTLIASVIIPVACGMAAGAGALVRVLLGPVWMGAATVVPFLALAVCMEMLARFGAVLLEATARLNVKLAIQVGYMALLVALFAVCARFGVVGFAAAWGMAMVAYHVAYSVALSRVLGIGWGDWARVYGGACATGIATAAALYGVARGGAAVGAAPVLVLAGQAAAGAVVLAASLLAGPQRAAARLVADRLPHLMGSAARTPFASRVVAYVAR